MRVIDLLNKIANGEEVPKKILFNSYRVYELDDYSHYMYENPLDNSFEDLFDYCENCELDEFLNDEVEIIEEDKKIEKCKNYCCYSDFINDNDKEKFYKELQNSMFKLTDKINEIIDKLNKEK